jgi:NadR type nicotinamide-nucleotide adenylyltransferase
MSYTSICVAGAESTGKSWLAHRLAAHYGIVPITEYARGYCAQHGNDLSMAQLIHIAEVQDSNIRGSMLDVVRQPERQHVIIADTDAVVTAVWAQAGYGRADPWFDRDFFNFDLTLVTENDLPWRDDGVRIQRDPAERDRWRALLIAELDRRGRAWVSVDGLGEARFTNALAAIEANLRRC